MKAILLLIAGLNAFAFHNGIYRNIAKWDGDGKPPRGARRAGMASLALWVAIVFCGRMIAYNWFDCAKPQSALVNAFAGCTPDMIEP